VFGWCGRDTWCGGTHGCKVVCDRCKTFFSKPKKMLHMKQMCNSRPHEGLLRSYSRYKGSSRSRSYRTCKYCTTETNHPATTPHTILSYPSNPLCHPNLSLPSFPHATIECDPPSSSSNISSIITDTHSSSCTNESRSCTLHGAWKARPSRPSPPPTSKKEKIEK